MHEFSFLPLRGTILIPVRPAAPSTVRNPSCSPAIARLSPGSPFGYLSHTAQSAQRVPDSPDTSGVSAQTVPDRAKPQGSQLSAASSAFSLRSQAQHSHLALRHNLVSGRESESRASHPSPQSSQQTTPALAPRQLLPLASAPAPQFFLLPGPAPPQIVPFPQASTNNPPHALRKPSSHIRHTP